MANYKRFQNASAITSSVLTGENFEGNNICDENIEEKTKPGFHEEMAKMQEQNAESHIIDLSTQHIPNHYIKDYIEVPVTAIVQPFASLQNGEEPDVISTNNYPLIRCKDCRGYINPFAKFIQKGKLWICPLCNVTNKVPDYYYQPTQHGERIDKYKRPELCKGSYEYIATSEYLSRPPMPPTYFFLIDVTKTSVESGYLEIFASTVKNIIDNQLLPTDDRTQIGIMTYDNSLHFYNLSCKLSQPQMIVMNEQDPYIPIPGSMILVNLNDSREIISTLLEGLPSMFMTTKSHGCNLFSALNVIHSLLKSSGGKIIVFQACPTISQIPFLKPPEQTSPGFNRLICFSDSTVRNKAAEMCHYSQISIDLFLFANLYKNLATLAELTIVSGGNLYYYPHFDKQIHGVKFENELYHSLTRKIGWEGYSRIRVSSGFKVTTVSGNFSFKSTDLIALPCVSPDKCFVYKIDHLQQTSVGDNKNNIYQNIKEFFIQCALLYSTSEGERRIRVHTSVFPISNNISDIVSNLNTSILTFSIAHFGVRQLKVKEGRDYIENTCRNLVSGIKVAHKAASQGEFSLPPSMDYFLIFCLGILKHPILSHEVFVGNPRNEHFFEYFLANLGCDNVNYLRMKFLDRSWSDAMSWFYPGLCALHTVEENQYGEYIQSEESQLPQINLPPAINLRRTSLDSEGMYLFDYGHVLYLWVGTKFNPDYAQLLFGVTSLSDIPLDFSEENLFPLNSDGEYELNDFSSKIYNIVQHFKAQRQPYSHLEILFEGSEKADLIDNLLIEDKRKGQQDYQSFYASIIKS